jgi:tape measure domain-containing protein
MDSRQLQIVLKLQDQATRELRKMTGDLNNVQRGATGAGGAFSSFAKQIAVAAGAYISFRSAYRALSIGVSIAADLQTAEVGLKTLLGSAEEAQSTIARLKVEAARTPFELPGLTQATQLLTSVTKDGDRSIDILLDVGEALAAMGKGQSELDRIIVNLQQVAAVGKAATIDIKQFAFAGIPIYEMLAETTGKTGEALAEMIDNGEITFDLLTNMFDEANDEGGRFFNAFVNQSGTFNQALSNMKDSFGIFMSDIVKNTGIFQGMTDAMIGVSNVLGDWQGSIQSVKDRLGELMMEIDAHSGLVTHFTEAWKSVVMVYQEQLAPALADLWEALKPLQPLLDAMVVVFGTALVIAIKVAGDIILGLILVLTQLFTWVAKINTYWAGVWVVTIDAIGTAIFKVTEFINGMIDAFRTAIELAKELGGGALDYVSGLLPGRASGGPVQSGQGYVVGERGPELFVPRTSGTIVPNHSLGGSGGGVNINVYGDVSGQELVDRVLEAIEGDIKRRIRVTA